MQLAVSASCQQCCRPGHLPTSGTKTGSSSRLVSTDLRLLLPAIAVVVLLCHVITVVHCMLEKGFMGGVAVLASAYPARVVP